MKVFDVYVGVKWFLKATFGVRLTGGMTFEIGWW